MGSATLRAPGGGSETCGGSGNSYVNVFIAAPATVTTTTATATTTSTVSVTPSTTGVACYSADSGWAETSVLTTTTTSTFTATTTTTATASFPSAIPGSSTFAIGCFAYDAASWPTGALMQELTNESCASYCTGESMARSGTMSIGTGASGLCMCATSSNVSPATQWTQGSCNSPCNGNSSEICGGQSYGSISVYVTL